MVSRCYLCGQSVEAVNHLFLYCKMTSQIWDLFISLRGIRCTMPGRTSEALTSWTTEGESSTHKDRRRNVPVTIRWTIWKERNSRCFGYSQLLAKIENELYSYVLLLV